ncbi:MAG TPA: HAMP domain-containing sensor histidine kinase [Planctomycetota bacterium]|nr:HAMP domain-containing sensor histidine kinase [Planctomycetota bacterium]
MTLAPSRLRMAFALTLALPAVFGGAWIWLAHGGAIERAIASERATAEQCLATASSALQEELHAAAAQAAFALELGPDRLVIGPFAGPSARRQASPVVGPKVGIAEQAATARFAAGDLDGALPFFAHASADGSLTADGWLAYAGVLAARDLAEGRRALADGMARHGDACCGNLPFALLAALREAAWLHESNASEAQRLQELGAVMFAAARAVPAESVPVVADAMKEALPALRSGCLPELTAAAAAALQLRGGPAPNSVQPGPARSVLVPLEGNRLGVLSAETTARLHRKAFGDAARLHPTVTLATLEDGAASTGPTLPVAALGETWVALPAATPTSTLLTQAGRASLGLAIATLVLGNLLLWRLTRRELALARLRAEFVDVVSHELRTPLTALSLKAEMLASGDVPPERVPHYLRALHGDVRRLDQQVERILDFGRLEQGAPLRRETVPARTVLARGLRAGRSCLRLVQQQLELDAPRSLPNLVGDLEVLGRALRNLLENATKYAPPGSTVGLRAFADGRTLVVEVADRGPGVPAAERAAIFQPFVRSSTAPASTPGSGLGLALVAAAAKAHGGRVDVREREGGGAVFTLCLPIASGQVAS